MVIDRSGLSRLKEVPRCSVSFPVVVGNVVDGHNDGNFTEAGMMNRRVLTWWMEWDGRCVEQHDENSDRGLPLRLRLLREISSALGMEAIQLAHDGRTDSQSPVKRGEKIT